MNNYAITVEWINEYASKLMDLAEQITQDHDMRASLLLRAEHALDLIDAFKASKEKEKQ